MPLALVRVALRLTALRLLLRARQPTQPLAHIALLRPLELPECPLLLLVVVGRSALITNVLFNVLTISVLAPVAEAEVVWATKTTSLLYPVAHMPLLSAQAELPLVGLTQPRLAADSLIL
jgi:hypothetical protein